MFRDNSVWFLNNNNKKSFQFSLCIEPQYRSNYSTKCIHVSQMLPLFSEVYLTFLWATLEQNHAVTQRLIHTVRFHTNVCLPTHFYANQMSLEANKIIPKSSAHVVTTCFSSELIWSFFWQILTPNFLSCCFTHTCCTTAPVRFQNLSCSRSFTTSLCGGSTNLLSPSEEEENVYTMEKLHSMVFFFEVCTTDLWLRYLWFEKFAT